MKTTKTFCAAIFLAVPMAAVAGGCGGGGDGNDGTGGAGGGAGSGGGNMCPFDYGSYSQQNTGVGFKDKTPGASPPDFNEVYPIIQRACNLTTCHGAGDALTGENAKGGLWMGPPLADGAPDDATLAQIFTEELLVASETAPSMQRIAPGDPSNSFLMVKLDGCQNVRGLTCTVLSGAVSDGVCGDDMPQSQPQLGDGERNLIRDWILEGAQNL